MQLESLRDALARLDARKTLLINLPSTLTSLRHILNHLLRHADDPVCVRHYDVPRMDGDGTQSLVERAGDCEGYIQLGRTGEATLAESAEPSAEDREADLSVFVQVSASSVEDNSEASASPGASRHQAAPYCRFHLCFSGGGMKVGPIIC